MNKAWLINIGNTHTEFAWWEGVEVTFKKHLSTVTLLTEPETSLAVLNNDPFPCVIACVVPGAKAQLARLLPAERLFWVHADLDLGIDLSMVDKTTIGADRLANMAAAVNECSLPVMVIDCGTAITTVAIDREKRFVGGAILPGRELQRWVLNQRTGQLPVIELQSPLPGALGTTTHEAIRAGIDLGILGALEKLIVESRQMMNLSSLTILAIGGDRDFFVTHLKGVNSGRDFTIRGLSWIARKYGIKAGVPTT